MSRPVVFGAGYSVYTRIVRLVLEEKGAAYDLHEVDVFQQGGPPADHLARHPFGRIPAFEHDGFALYETAAITRYIDAVFPGQALCPETPRERARVDQIVGILDSYAYRAWVWDVFVERVRVSAQGGTPDEARIAAGARLGATCLGAIAGLMPDDAYLCGADLTLADLHAAPMIALLRLAPEGARLLADSPKLSAWWARMDARPSMAATRPPVESAA